MTELPSHVSEFPFQNFSMFRRIRFIVLEKKTDILILNVKIKNLCNLSNEKTQLLSLITGVMGKRCGEEGAIGIYINGIGEICY